MATPQYVYYMHNLSKTYPGGKQVLKDISLYFIPGAKIGVVGVNGAGKSTLLKIMAGTVEDYVGEAWAADGIKVGYLAQEPELDTDKTVLENAMEGVHEKKAMLDRFNELAMNYSDETADEMAQLQDQIDAQDLWDLDTQVEQALDALRCPPSDGPVDSLSGGEKRRVALTKLLLSKPDILLLDEPTNHLDAESVAWLERFLKDYNGCVILVTHDRYFLDNITEWTLELDRGQGVPYKGNYSAWLEQKAKRLDVEKSQEEAKQRALKRELEWIRSSPRARQAKSKARIDAYEKLAEKAGREEVGSAQIRIPPGPKLGGVVIEAEGVCKGFEDRLLIDDLSFKLPPGGIVGVIGPNGAGKTTFVRCLLGQIEPTAGTVTLGTKLAIGYFTQTHEDLDPELSVVRYLQKIVRKECPDQLMSEQAARDLAGAFLFSGPSQERELGLMSGGERARAVLAGLMASAKNVLVLDEPTNHLDIPSAERLEEVLRRPPTPDELALDETLAERGGGLFDGTLILISHDRAMLEACCSKLIVLDGKGNAEVFPGRWSDWERAEQRRAQAAEDRAGAKTRRPDASKAKKQETDKRKDAEKKAPAPAPVPKPASSEKPKKSKWSWMRLEQLEEKIAAIEEELGGIDKQLEDPEIWTEYEKAEKLTNRRDELRVDLEGLEAEWVRKAE